MANAQVFKGKLNNYIGSFRAGAKNTTLSIFNGTTGKQIGGLDLKGQIQDMQPGIKMLKTYNGSGPVADVDLFAAYDAEHNCNRFWGFKCDMGDLYFARNESAA